MLISLLNHEPSSSLLMFVYFMPKSIATVIDSITSRHYSTITHPSSTITGVENQAPDANSPATASSAQSHASVTTTGSPEFPTTEDGETESDQAGNLTEQEWAEYYRLAEAEILQGLAEIEREKPTTSTAAPSTVELADMPVVEQPYLTALIRVPRILEIRLRPSIKRKTGATAPAWTNMCRLNEISYRGKTYRVGQNVLGTTDVGRLRPVRIFDIRKFDDRRGFIAVLFFHTRPEALDMGADVTGWPYNATHVLSTRLEALTWASLHGEVTPGEYMLGGLEILDLSNHEKRLWPLNSPLMDWLRTGR